jgi:hypothetical protein
MLMLPHVRLEKGKQQRFSSKEVFKVSRLRICVPKTPGRQESLLAFQRL